MIKRFVLRHLIKSTLNLNKPLEEVRKDVEKLKIKQKKKETTYVENVVIDETPCMWVVPEGCDTYKFIVYLHGGGYCLGVYDNTIQRTIDLAESLDITVLMIDYPIAPENPYPSAIMKVNSIYESVSKGKKVALLGESSGCGLALNLMVHLRENKGNQPISTIMLTPFLDATYSSESCKKIKDKDPFYVESPYIVSDYYTEGLDTKDPMVSPIYHEVHDLAPILIHVAEYDTLADDGTALYRKLKISNGIATYKMWKGMWHLFHTQHALLAEGRKAMIECKDFLHEHYTLLDQRSI